MKREVEIGRYLKTTNGTIGLIVGIDKDGDIIVVDDDGDRTTFWNNNNWEYVTDEERIQQGIIILPKISEGYNAVIDLKKRIVTVGCQEITFETVASIYKATIQK